MASAPQGLVFNVQRFSVHDGPGIRTTVFFKGCPLRCRWCQNPESLAPRPELLVFAERCRRTGDCVGACPSGALRVDGAVSVARAACDACGRCVPACPFDALEVVGRRVSVDELFDEVARDATFYRSTGGGVTLSGGEATRQLPFVVAFLGRCAEVSIDVGLQTCGVFSWRALAPHLGQFAFVHYDLKVMDPEAHRRLTGGDNRRILDNARRLVAAGAPVTFRLPVVPGHTDDDANLRAVAAFLSELGAPRLHLLRYHALGEVKSARLGDPLPALGIDRGRSDESFERARATLQDAGLAVAADPEGAVRGAPEVTA